MFLHYLLLFFQVDFFLLLKFLIPCPHIIWYGQSIQSLEGA